jgi:hypothetical protein
MNIDSTAYHEAGHAVAAWWLGHPPKQVTIAPGDGYEGRAQHASPFRNMSSDVSPAWTDPESVEGVRMMRRFDHAIIITLAGPLAQKRHNPRSHWRFGATGSRAGEHVSHGSDYQQVSDLIFRVYEGADKVADAYWRYMEARAEALVERLWPRIERLARVLLERETLTGREIREAITDPLVA